jgi:tetratricopeptide (TPR) repeat protein
MNVAGPCALALFGLLLQSALPPLPTIALDAFPSSARASIAKAHDAAKARPQDADAVCAFARTLQAWEQWEAAHQAFARCQVLAPKAFDARYLDAIVLQRLARHEEALAQLRLALAVDGTYVAARMRLAESLYETRAFGESRRVFSALLTDPNAEPASRVGIARIDASEGRHQEAVDHLQQATKLYPELGPAYYAMAMSLRALGRADEARRALERHAEYGARWPAVPDPVRDAVTMLRDDAAANVQRGVKLSGAGDLQGAIAAHEAAVARDPNFAQARTNLISLYGRAGEWAKAEAHYAAVVRLDGSHDDAHYDYGVILGLQEKWDAAAEAYGRAIAANPGHARARNNLGQILERRKESAAAAEMYRQAVANQPAFRLARFNLARMLIALDRHVDAIAELEPIVEPRDAESPRYLFALATAHLHAGHKDEGVRVALEARDLAAAHGQKELAVAIDRELARIKQR